MRVAVAATPTGPARPQSLLLYSSVCGVGLDCVPLSLEDSAEADVAATLADVAALSLKWRKPLSCRSAPAPGPAPLPASRCAAPVAPRTPGLTPVSSLAPSRLFFVKGARAGDRTRFQSPYLCNTAVMSL